MHPAEPSHGVVANSGRNLSCTMWYGQANNSGVPPIVGDWLPAGNFLTFIELGTKPIKNVNEKCQWKAAAVRN